MYHTEPDMSSDSNIDEEAGSFGQFYDGVYYPHTRPVHNDTSDGLTHDEEGASDEGGSSSESTGEPSSSDSTTGSALTFQELAEPSSPGSSGASSVDTASSQPGPWPEIMYVNTQYTPPATIGEPLVIADTQLSIPRLRSHGSAIEVMTSPVLPAFNGVTSPIPVLSPSPVPEPQPRLGTLEPEASQGSARGEQRKHRLSSVGEHESPESDATHGKKIKSDKHDDQGNDGTASGSGPANAVVGEGVGEGVGQDGEPGCDSLLPRRQRTQFKCAVCLDAPDPAVYVHPCGHVFCEGCAQGAVRTTGRCPVCRHVMRTKNIRVLQFRLAPIGCSLKQ